MHQPRQRNDDRLRNYAESLYERVQTATRHATNEAELRRVVEPVMDEALAELYGLDFHQIRSERINENGRFDIAYGGVVVEFEWQMGNARRRHGAEQALNYLAAERERHSRDNIFTAVVVDGREWGFLVDDEAASEVLELFGETASSPEDRFIWHVNSVAACRRFLELVGSHRQIPVTGASLVEAFGRGSDIAREVVSRFIEAIHNRAPSGRIDTLYVEWRRALEVAYGPLDDSSARVLARLREQYDLATLGSLGELLFALHTYFALVARLVAAEILAISVNDAESRPSQWPALADDQFASCFARLEGGEVPRGLSISNLFEGDVFSWYLDRLLGTVTFSDALRRICARLHDFAFPRLAYGSTPATDLLRDLYHGLTTRELRKALGEFLTPNWLAQATLSAARRNGGLLSEGRVLDCTCGTGTFLRPVLSARLRQLRQRAEGIPTASRIQEVLNGIVGIDINPVAVIATRMNYLMALGELATAGDLYLPVWLSDAVLLPGDRALQRDLEEHPRLQGCAYRVLQTSLTEPFVVPIEFNTQDSFARLAGILRAAVRQIASGEEIPANRLAELIDDFLDRAKQELGPESEHAAVATEEQWRNSASVLSVLYEQLLTLHAEGRDEVWAEIIENRFAPLFIGPFDLVVGNPPWLSWKKLPAAWKARAEPLWREYGLFRVPDVPGVDRLHSLQSSDIAVLVTAVALERYLRPGGLLAFVLPKGVINGDAANRAFRLYHLNSDREPTARREVHLQYCVREVQDFSDVRPFSPDAANEPIVLVIQPGEQPTFPVPGYRWSRRTGRLTDGSWDEVRRRAIRSEQVQWAPISTYDASPLAWWHVGEQPLRRAPSKYTFGMGFNTRGAAGVFHIELRGRVNANTNHVRIANLPDAGAKEVPQVIGNVNAQLVIPVVRGQHITPFSVEPDGYVLIAHDPADRSRPLTLQEMRRPEYRRTFDFLSNFRQMLLERPPYRRFRPQPDLWWHVGNCEQLGANGTLLCVQEIASRPAAAVLRPVWDAALGRTVLPIPNHKVVFYRTADENEAYYLAAVINSLTAQDLLQRFANFLAISPQTIRYLPIPTFQSGNAEHVAIAELSVQAHTDPTDKELVEVLNDRIAQLVR